MAKSPDAVCMICDSFPCVCDTGKPARKKASSDKVPKSVLNNKTTRFKVPAQPDPGLPTVPSSQVTSRFAAAVQEVDYEGRATNTLIEAGLIKRDGLVAVVDRLSDRASSWKKKVAK